MDQETYQIELIFEVAQTSHNFARGNLFVQSEFKSFKKGKPSLTLARSGFLNPKGALTLTLKEMACMLPLFWVLGVNRLLRFEV